MLAIGKFCVEMSLPRIPYTDAFDNFFVAPLTTSPGVPPRRPHKVFGNVLTLRRDSGLPFVRR